MLKELIEIFSECQQMKAITPCSSAVDCDSVALMPKSSGIIKKYTDGKTLEYVRLKLLYKAQYSPDGDKNFIADSFFENVSTWLRERFEKSSADNGKYSFNLSDISPSYTVEKKTPSVAIYSLELTVNYLNL
ncbi:MAG: hypothetical protein J6A69_12355 [Clostridia bacterium]|nr:hypothetical protein [Clostridia bacterium]